MTAFNFHMNIGVVNLAMANKSNMIALLRLMGSLEFHP